MITANKKVMEYTALNLDNLSAEEREKAILLRRGLENVVVTLRDMSRSVTKRDPQNRAELTTLADSLAEIQFGVGEEAKKFKAWLNNGNSN